VSSRSEDDAQSQPPRRRRSRPALPPAVGAPFGDAASVALGIDSSGTITEREYRQFQALVERESGIHLGPEKKALLVGRLRRRVIALGLGSFSAYYRLVTEDDPDERVRMLDSISTNETSFFREPRQFDFLQEHVLPAWTAEGLSGKRQRRIRAWSAACSTGEEPFSLAMILLDRFPAGSGWAVEVLGSDLSTRVLAKAETATWPVEKVKEIPQSFLRRYMLRGTRSQQGKMRATAILRETVAFRRVNLNESAYPVQGPFDLIFCRNVLMYFAPVVCKRVVHRLLDLLAPWGYLFLGHAESLSGLSERARNVGPAVYQHEPGS
jgi:chemotaxis protein methyltransferase CheR